MATREKKKAQMRKAARKEANGSARLSQIAMSARKARAVANMIRGKTVDSALALLAVQKRKAGRFLSHVLLSAVANATERGFDVDELKITDLQVHGGAIRKRFLTRAQGRATTIRKRSAHIDLEVGNQS